MVDELNRPMPNNEESLVKRAQKQDPAAFTQIYEQYFDKIYRYLVIRIGNQMEAEDLTQQVFLRALRSISNFKWKGVPFSAWLYRIATHVALDRLRQRARRGPKESDLDLDEIELPDRDAVSLQQNIERGEMSACVQQYLADLPDTYRAVILLHDMEELTGWQIAELLDLPLATVKIRLHRARRRLQAALRAGCEFSTDERNVLVCESKH